MNKLLLYSLVFLSFLNSCQKSNFSSDDYVAPEVIVDLNTVSERASCSTCLASATISGTCPKVRTGAGGISLDVMLFTKGWSVCSPAANPSSTFTGCVQWIPQSGTIKFSDYSDLRAVLGIPTGNTDQAHHIVPKQLCDAFSSGSQLHPVVRKAARHGFHPNDGYNGYRVPQVNHSGSHPNYTNWVLFELNRYNTNNPNATVTQANTYVQCTLIPALRTRIANAIAAGQTINTYFNGLPQLP